MPDRRLPGAGHLHGGRAHERAFSSYCQECGDLKIPEILQVETPQVPGSLASVLNVIAEAGLILEHVTTLRREQGRTLWEITLEIDAGAQEDLLRRLSSLPSARFIGWSDRVF